MLLQICIGLIFLFAYAKRKISPIHICLTGMPTQAGSTPARRLCFARGREIRYYRFVDKYPKGPTPLSFIGHFLQRDFGARRLSEGFDGLSTIFFPLLVVHIKDYALIREAFVDKGDDFADRPRLRLLQLLRSFTEEGGVVNSNDEIWREQRRTAVSILRDFGMGRNLLEQLVNSSISGYIKHLDEIADKQNVNMRWPIQIMIANIINELMFGFRYEYNDCDTLIRYVDDLNSVLGVFARNKFVLLGIGFPFLNKLPWIGYHTFQKHKDHSKYVNQYIVDCVDRAIYKVDEEPACFVHAYKQRMIKNEKLDNPNLMATCAEFFLAGQETTTTTLRWAMLLLTKHTEAQEKLLTEIRNVVGTDRLPSLSDQPQACALECYTRALSFTRFSGSRTFWQRMFRGQQLEIRKLGVTAGTMVYADTHYVMAHDPVFESPEEFRPERYLTEDGKGLRKDLLDRTLPFSLGKRVCAGESLARVELFLGLTATFQRYRLSARPGETIDLKPILQPIKITKEQNVIIERI